MFRLGSTLLFAACTLSSVPAQEIASPPSVPAPEAPPPLAYVIPIKNMIEPALLYVVRRGIDEATRHNADAIVFAMDTPGGTVDAAGKIIAVITRCNIPTYTFVERGAYSAGAVIALAAGEIYMAPGSVIGAATPMMMSPGGGVQDMPDEVQEKMTSAMAAMVRAAAEQGGHDPKLAEAMVRADIEYRIDGKILSEKGRLLTLTNTEAEQLVGKEEYPLLSSGTVKDIDEMLTAIHLPNAEKRVIEVTGAEQIARAVAKTAPILMLIGMAGLWLELRTPGFGFFGILGGGCLLLFFFGHHIAGLSGMEDLLLFIAGIALIAIEVFVTPGFGFLGAGGLILVLVSFISAMSEHMPGSWRPASFEPDTFARPLINVLIAFGGSVVLAAVAGCCLPRSKLLSRVTLHETITHEKHGGSLIGLEGLASSDLRPSGSALFNNRKYNVVTQGEFIDKETPIRIVSAHGARIVVEAI